MPIANDVHLPPFRPAARQAIPALHEAGGPAICRARGLTLAQAHAWVDEAAGDAQRAAIELAAADELRALAAVIDQAITDAGSYSPLVLAKAVLAAGYRR